MKRLVFILMLAMAQNMVFGLPIVASAAGTPTPSAPPKTRPVAAMQPQAGGSAEVGAPNQNPVHLLGMRFHQVMIQIQKAHKAKSLTDAQAKDLRTQVMDIRKQEMADFKANGSRTLTNDQISQLNGQLDTVSNSLTGK